MKKIAALSPREARSAAGARRTPGAQPGAQPERLRVLKLALPLAMAIVLSMTFIALLIVQTRKATDDRKETPAAGVQPLPRPVTPDAIPHGSPTDKNPYAPPPDPAPRFGGKYPRWNLKEFPAGWDDGIAQTLHSYFEELTYDPSKPIDMARIENARNALKDYLAQLGPDAVSTLGAILNAEGDFVNRRFLLYAVGDLGPQSPEATFVLRDFFVARHADPQNRSEMIHAVKAMENLKNDTAFDTLADFVERGGSDPGFHSYRGNFIESLGEHPRREEALDTLIGTMHEDQLIDARNKSAQALGKIRSPETLPELYNALEKERYWVIKQTILGTIGKIGSPDSFPVLEGQARAAKESGVRLSAMSAIRRIGTPQGEQTLRSILRDETDPEVRKRVEAWLAGKE